ncbi:hypothetical protein FQA39_LY12306 [Lamprigera yunnana]|nr:hypothetical protein FQA39_LY12306 [Lamprigera yunnana]
MKRKWRNNNVSKSLEEDTFLWYLVSRKEVNIVLQEDIENFWEVMPEGVASTSSFDPTTNANAEDQHLPEERKTKFLDKGVQVYIKPHFRSKATTTEFITTIDNATSTNTVIVKSVTISPITVKLLLIPDLDVTRTTMDTSSSVSQISMNSFYTDQNDNTYRIR